ncbi:hypothetical protein MHUMG1_08200 [Metarhizium humberi]|uniref:Uncharacterized protein n=1 Tax=Metarhizium humberi TaxID=2596975 RepID=A0A9P8M4N1_9HYPO|nr:hypothetical protein MHUMG1_08200 [Metarhizium humberi]
MLTAKAQVAPASTVKTVPVIHLASPPAKNLTGPAQSHAFPSVCNRLLRLLASLTSADMPPSASYTMGVYNIPTKLTGTNAIHPHPILSMVRRHSPRHIHHGALTRRIQQTRRAAAQARHRPQIHNAPAHPGLRLIIPHRRHRILGHEHHARDIDLEAPRPPRRVHVDRRARGPQHPDPVHQHVHPPKHAQRRVHDPRALLGRRHVRRHRQRRRPLVLREHQLRRPLRERRLAVHADHLGPVLGEQERDGAPVADGLAAAAGARDDGHLAVEAARRAGRVGGRHLIFFFWREGVGLENVPTFFSCWANIEARVICVVVWCGLGKVFEFEDNIL